MMIRLFHVNILSLLRVGYFWGVYTSMVEYVISRPKGECRGGFKRLVQSVSTGIGVYRAADFWDYLPVWISDFRCDLAVFSVVCLGRAGGFIPSGGAENRATG